MFFFALSLIAYSISIAWLLRGTRYNVVIATLFHFTINISTYIFFLHAANDPDYMRVNAIIWIESLVLSFYREENSSCASRGARGNHENPIHHFTRWGAAGL